MAKKRIGPKLAEFASLMAIGLTQHQICKEMGLHTNEYESLRSRFYRELELEHTGKTTIKVFLDYVNRQGRLVKDLEELKQRMKGGEGKKEIWATGSGAQAYVGAIKVQADIYDRMIATGQSLELIKKAPKRIEYIGGRHVGDMTSEQLEMEIANELQNAQKLVDQKRSRNAKKVLALYPAPASSSDNK